MVEYGLAIGLIAVVCIASLSATGKNVSDVQGKTAACIQAAVQQTQGAPVCPICGLQHS